MSGPGACIRIVRLQQLQAFGFAENFFAAAGQVGRIVHEPFAERDGKIIAVGIA